ncbi:hypothetical protein SLE2022_338540 [Rubroshorea leprosula]
MYQNFLCSICKPFAYIRSLKSIHTCCEIVTKSVSFSRNSEEFLATRLAAFLESCSAPVSAILEQNRQVHAQFIVNGVSRDSPLGGKILGIYILCGCFIDAKDMFFQLDLCRTMPWNSMIRGFVKMGWFEFALLFYFKMLGCGVFPDRYTFPSVIKACGGLNNVRLGTLVHDMICFMGFEVDVFVGSSLIKFYVENGCIYDAHKLFDKITEKDCVLWNVMLNGYVKCGEWGKTIVLFEDMLDSQTKPNSVTFVCILSLCASEGMIDLGTQLHGLVVHCGFEFDSSVGNTLLSMYCKCGQLSDARKLFNLMPQNNVVTWNGMIAGHVQSGFMKEASQLFQEMLYSVVKPDSITFSSFLPSVVKLASPKIVKEIHGYIVRNGVILDMFLRSALIDVYFKCGNVEMAHKIYDQSTMIDVVVCTAMISGYVLNGMNRDGLKIFRQLLQEKISPNYVTLASTLPASAGLTALKLGKELHGYIIKNGLDQMCLVASAVMDMYAKCGRLDLAYQIFMRLSDKDSICWNSMITSCSQNGKPEEAIDLFCQMGNRGFKYDGVSISAALSACANLTALHNGKEIHGFMIKGSVPSDLFAESALIDMYAKCGNLDFAQRVFDMMQEKNDVSWNSIIAAYGNHGCLKDSLALFNKMLDTGIQPDHVTFLAILSACGHAGKVDNGIQYFLCMTKEYGIPARMEHYACMVDLFGRAGRLNKAFEIIKSMPFSPDAGVWGTLLGACRNHGNVELAEVASRHLFDLDPQNSGYYILLSNIHANAGRWGSVREIRSFMKERGVQKVPGYSWIEVNNNTHVFCAADESHPQSAQIYLLLKTLLLEMKQEGYVPQLYLQMHPQTFVV